MSDAFDSFVNKLDAELTADRLKRHGLMRSFLKAVRNGEPIKIVRGRPYQRICVNPDCKGCACEVEK